MHLNAPLHLYKKSIIKKLKLKVFILIYIQYCRKRKIINYT